MEKYFQNYVTTMTNKNGFAVWAQFQFRESGSNDASAYIKAGVGQWVQPNNTAIFRIKEDAIIYKRFSYNFDLEYKDYKKVKVEY